MGMFDNNNNKRQFFSPSKMGMITGDVVEIGEIHQVDFYTKQPKFFKNSGDPITQMTITLCDANGQEWVWAFNERRCFGPGNWGDSTAVEALKKALQEAGLTWEAESLGGLNITVSSPEGSYGMNNPRPFVVQVNGQGTHPFRGVTPLVPLTPRTTQAYNPQMMQQYVQQQPMMQQPQMQQPMMQQPQMMAPQQQPMMGQPVVGQQPAFPTDPQAMATAGMITQAMPGAQVTMMNPYDGDIPF